MSIRPVTPQDVLNFVEGLRGIVQQAEQTYAEVKAHESTRQTLVNVREQLTAMRAERDSHSRKIQSIEKDLRESQAALDNERTKYRHTTDRLIAFAQTCSDLGWDSSSYPDNAEVWLAKQKLVDTRALDEQARVLGTVMSERNDAQSENMRLKERIADFEHDMTCLRETVSGLRREAGQLRSTTDAQARLLNEIRNAASAAGCSDGQTVASWITQLVEKCRDATRLRDAAEQQLTVALRGVEAIRDDVRREMAGDMRYFVGSFANKGAIADWIACWRLGSRS